MKKWNDSFYSGFPKKDGKYLVKANDMVNAWEDELIFKGGEWYMLNGDLFPALIDEWREI